MAEKKILGLDFDNTCMLKGESDYDPAVADGDPVEGLWEFLHAAVGVFEVNILSARNRQPGGIEAMKVWFYEHAETVEDIRAVNQLQFPREKPPVFVGLDDRVLTFRGQFPDVQELENFRSWTEKEKGAGA